MLIGQLFFNLKTQKTVEIHEYKNFYYLSNQVINSKFFFLGVSANQKMSKTFAVTGASGYIASSLIK
jgi:hypothetical protein